MASSREDRRQYPRVNAPVFFRPVGVPLFGRGRGRALDVSLGGARVYSDEAVRVGTPFDLELVLPSGETVSCRADVVWIEPLPEGAPARYDVGLRFTEISPEARAQLASVLAAVE